MELNTFFTTYNEKSLYSYLIKADSGKSFSFKITDIPNIHISISYSGNKCFISNRYMDKPEYINPDGKK